MKHRAVTTSYSIGKGLILQADAIKVLEGYEGESFQLILADPPYYQVLVEQEWDNAWQEANDYLEWTLQWVRACRKVLRPDGLLYIFGQLGKREHIWLHVCSALTREMQFHDMLIWDRAVGYNERSDSFTPQYEMILALRQTSDARPHFDKSVVRCPTIKNYSDLSTGSPLQGKGGAGKSSAQGKVRHQHSTHPFSQGGPQKKRWGIPRKNPSPL